MYMVIARATAADSVSISGGPICWLWLLSCASIDSAVIECTVGAHKPTSTGARSPVPLRDAGGLVHNRRIALYCSHCAVFMSGLVEGEPREPAAEEHTEVDQGVLHIGDDRVAEDGREDSEVLADDDRAAPASVRQPTTVRRGAPY